MSKREQRSNIIKKLKNVFVLTLLPILFTFLFGGVYVKTFVQEIPMVILDEDGSSLSRMIIDQFAQSENFQVVQYAGSYEEIKNSIQSKKAVAGLIFPENFAKDVKELRAPKTLLIIDGTNIVTGNSAFSYASTILNTLNAGVQMKILQSKGILPASSQKIVKSLSFVDRTLYNPELSYMKYFFIALIGIFLQQTFLAVMVPMLIEEKQRSMGWKGFLRVPIRWMLIVGLAMIGFTGSLYYAHKTYSLPLRGDLGSTYILFFVFIMNLTGVALLLGAIFKDSLHSVQLTMLLSVPTLLTSGYAWPEYMMPERIRNGVKSIWPLIYFINPLKDLHIKGSAFYVIRPYVLEGIGYAKVWVPMGLLFYLLSVLHTRLICASEAKI